MVNKKTAIKIILSYYCILVAVLFCILATLRIGFEYDREFNANMEYSSQYNSVYNANQDNLKIMVLSDLHFMKVVGLTNYITYKKLDKALKLENPDLVVINGDVVWGLFNGEMLEEVASFFEQRQIYWCYNYGNHDYQFGESQTRLASRLEKYSYALFNYGFSNLTNGGNYVVEIKRNNELKFSFVFVNSGGGKLAEKQTDWYSWQINGLNQKAGHNVSSAFFMHIPFEVVKTYAESGRVTGDYLERVNPVNDKFGLLEKMIELNSTKYVFSGHDHPNDFYFDYSGIRFRAVRASSYSAYQRAGQKQGCTIMNLDLITNTITDDKVLVLSDL